MKQTKCNRCGRYSFGTIMSWFTDEIICILCSHKEGNLRQQLPNNGISHEGCGYIPIKEAKQ